MFNKMLFNRGPFNRPFAIETYFTATFSSSTDVSSRMSIDFPVTVTIDSATDVSAQMVREIPFRSEIETATELLTKMIRERIMPSTTFDTSSEFVAEVTYYHVDEISFIGDFKPGDRLVIDSAKMTVTINGQNALHLTDGDFFKLVLGINKLTYTDQESARNILTRITHRDKFLY